MTTTATETSQAAPQPIFRKDYRAPDYLIDTVELRFELDEERTLVRSRMAVRRNPEAEPGAHPLVLDGAELELLSVQINGQLLGADHYQVEAERLVLPEVPETFTLEIETATNPKANTALEGLYRSGSAYCTQCEAEGFRRITYYLDRPDVLARYTTTIVADKDECPVLLSNGNRVEEGELGDGRHWVKWEDPFPKPCYLFALVAGRLERVEDRFTTRSGREVKIEFYVEAGNEDRCAHAVQALKDSMRWDEEVFGLEYDLDIYMIVAVSDFNMGAMENKGLNVFNTKYVLASPATATDDDFEAIQGVIAHEYFHNWTGNRVTCRDWFQLSLKEGLTVYRDQRFSEDMTSRGVKRIQEVRILRSMQFAEDAGPTAHPVRPESYIEMNNFYTVTVYNKGAEVVRMYETLLGREGFRKGMDLYFERHDGQAVTCDDFRAAMADANGVDLTQFENWYLQAGTPELRVSGKYDAGAKTYVLEVEQSCPATPGQPEKAPFHLPIAFSLLGPDGGELPLALKGEPRDSAPTERVLQLSKRKQTFRFEGVEHAPTPSVLRGFSAPVKLHQDLSREQLAFLAAHDTDDFNRWEAGQALALQVIHAGLRAHAKGRAVEVEPRLFDAFKATLQDPDLDRSLLSQALLLPDEAYIGETVDEIDPGAVHAVREEIRRAVATELEAELVAAYDAHTDAGEYTLDRAAIGRRRVKNVCLMYLAALESEEHVARAAAQFRDANNMTDSLAALHALADLEGPEREEALATFEQRWIDDPLVMDKWFRLQATSKLESTLERVRALKEHSAFSLRNPNKVYSLILGFAVGNPARFHAPDGSGYRFLADTTLELNELNPQVAARVAKTFSRWRRYEKGRRELMKAELERLAAADLSRDVYEIVRRSLDPEM